MATLDNDNNKAKKGLDSDTTQAWRESRLTCVPTAAYVDCGAGRSRVEVLDVSRSGICFVLDKPLGVGSSVIVALGPLKIGGEVRYCRRHEENLFKAGMRIDSTERA